MTTTTRVPTSSRRARLYLVIDKTCYQVRPLACDPVIGRKAFRLQKGDGTHYNVAATHHGAQCDCPDYIYRREGLDPSGCKHVQALISQGLLDGETRPAGR